MKLETAFRQNRVDPFLKKLPRSWFTGIQAFSHLGLPDKVGCVGGWFVAIELKREGKEATPLQRGILNLISKAGGKVFVAKPSNWNEVRTALIILTGDSDPGEN